jgi:hypothetical protein
MTNFKGFASLILVAAAITTLSAETRCPGNVASVPLLIVNRQKILVGVSINHSGPYDFILDTGSQFTLIDLSLAAELHLSVHDSARVVGSFGSFTSASFTQVERLEAGAHAAANQTVLVYGLQKLNSVVYPVRGILGEDFLGRFDMLIDNAHRLLCLDDSAILRANLKGSRIALVTPAQSAENQLLADKLIVAVRINNASQPVRLVLDSGSDVSLLYTVSRFTTGAVFAEKSLPVKQVDGAQRAFSVLPPQEVKIGPLNLSRVLFVIPRGVETAHSTVVDGLLPTALFRRVFIDHVNHIAVLDPW